MALALQVVAQVLVQRPLQVPLQPDEPPSGKSKSISQEVSEEGKTVKAMAGRTTPAAFLKNFRLLMISSLRFFFIVRSLYDVRK